MKKIEIPKYFKEICSNCGCTKGAHHGGTAPFPYDYCPRHEGRMDWDEGPGTCFKPSGLYKEEKEVKNKHGHSNNSK